MFIAYVIVTVLAIVANAFSGGRSSRPRAAGGDRGAGRAAAYRGHDRSRRGLARRPLSPARGSRHTWFVARQKGRRLLAVAR
jgi:hypothetical protein